MSEGAVATISRILDRQVSKGRLDSADAEASLGRITTSTSFAGVGDCDLVVEAVPESREVKQAVFRELATGARADAILASNTSSISITELAAAVPGPDRFIGMHFMNPVPVMQLVEVIRGLETSDQTLERVNSVCTGIGKVPIEVNDYPGFVANRILMPMINEAVFCLMEGVATPENVDTVMKLGMRRRSTA